MISLFKPICGYLLFTIYAFLNLLPKNNDYLFMSYPDASDNSWALFKNIVKYQHDKKIIWLVENYDESIINKINKYVKNNNKVYVVKKWSIKGIINFTRSKFIFHTHGSYFFVRKSWREPIIINLWHGMPIKKLGVLDGQKKNALPYSHFSIATSVFYQKKISIALNIPLNNVLNIGLPRNDVFIENIDKDKKSTILASIRLHKNTEIITWLPTYRNSFHGEIRSDSKNSCFINELPDSFLEDLDKKLCEINAYVIIKLHPMDILNKRKVNFYFKNIIFFTADEWTKLNIELYDVLSISAALISDVSSVIIDFIPTNKPIGIIGNIQEYSRGFIQGIEPLLNDLYPITEAKDVTNLLQSHQKPSLKIYNESHRLQSSKYIIEKIINNAD